MELHTINHMELHTINNIKENLTKAICIILASALLFPGAFASSTKIYPSADSFVRDRTAGTNYGDSSNLRAGYNINFGTDRGYLKFDLSSVPDRNSIIFSIDPVFHQGAPVINLYLVPTNSWSESSINWNNKPSYTTLLASQTISSNDRLNFTIPASSISGNTFSIVIKEQSESSSSNTDVQFYSKELDTDAPGDENYWPFLQVSSDGAPQCPSSDFSNVCCALTPIQMMNFINAFNRFQTSYTPIQMMNFINHFNRFEPLC